MERTRGIMETAKEIANRITAEIPELKVIGGTKAMIVCWESNLDYSVVPGQESNVNVHT